MLRIGLTGGIASGKSKVAEMFAALGAGIVDTDAIAREVVAPGSPGLAAVRAAFGESVIGSDGALDRRKLRSIVFADRQLRERLEALLHPLIRARTLQRVEEARAAYVIIVVPLLVETDFIEIVDRVLVVDCPRETQIARVIERDGVDRNAAEAIIAAQTDRATRLAAADDVLDNSASIEHAREQVAALHERYSELARDCRSRRGRAE